MKKKEPQKFDCPIRNTMELIQGKWTFSIVFLLMKEGTMRYNQLTKILDTISSRILCKELQELVENGIATRQTYPTVPPTVEYSLTEKGKDLYEVSIALRDWGRKYTLENTPITKEVQLVETLHSQDVEIQFANR
jgi:DNA-binding HxlR family transcriptional regulator